MIWYTHSSRINDLGMLMQNVFNSGGVYILTTPDDDVFD
jgi:hypothetical protein